MPYGATPKNEPKSVDTSAPLKEIAGRIESLSYSDMKTLGSLVYSNIKSRTLDSGIDSTDVIDSLLSVSNHILRGSSASDECAF